MVEGAAPSRCGRTISAAPSERENVQIRAHPSQQLSEARIFAFKGCESRAVFDPKPKGEHTSLSPDYDCSADAIRLAALFHPLIRRTRSGSSVNIQSED
jgi:hypothetical protein